MGAVQKSNDTLVPLELAMRINTILKDIDDITRHLLRGSKRRILLDGETSVHFGMYETILGSLAHDKRINCFLTSSWEDGPQIPISQCIQQAGGISPFMPWEKARKTKWDAYISTCFDNAWLLRKTQKVDIFHGISEKWSSEGDHPYMVNWRAKNYDAIFCPYEEITNYYTNGYPSYLDHGHTKAITTGAARTDTLAWLNIPEICWELRRELGLDQEDKVAYFAPTYGDGGLLHECGEKVINLCADLFDHTFIRLHPCSFMDDERFNGGVDWGSRLSRYQDNRKVTWQQSLKHLALMLIADVMISDFSTGPLEFSLLDKPFLFYSPEPQRMRIGGNRKQWTLMYQAGGAIDTEEELICRIKQFPFEENVQDLASRKTLKNKYFPFIGNATENTLHELYKILGLSFDPSIVYSHKAELREKVRQEPKQWLGVDKIEKHRPH